MYDLKVTERRSPFMDAITHTLIAVVMLMAAYYFGRYFSKRTILEEIVNTMLDNLERDGYVSVKTNVAGEKELIKIEDLVKKGS